MSQKFEWKCCIPKKTLPLKKLLGEETIDHPLKPATFPKSEPRIRHLGGSSISSGSSVIIDPLTSSLDGDDPLSAMAAEKEWDDGLGSNESSKNQFTIFGLKPWIEQRSEILNKFTTSQKLSVTTSFLQCGERVKTQNPSNGRNRLEQWDDVEDGSVKEIGHLTQQEYTERISQLNKELVEAWHQDFRVNALKITIQCSKLLVDTSVIQFYPSKFVLITDTLDIFGKLVYERLWSKCEYYPEGSRYPSTLPKSFTSEMVPESAKETCRNWFYKIASIRELVPRLYLEAAVLKSYSFLTNKGFSQALNRLTRMVRGIGDPLVAIYARCYLCRIGMSVSTIDTQFLKGNFYDFLDVYEQLYSSSIRLELNRQKIDMATYLGTYAPALDWILQGLTYNANESLLDEILEKCANKKHKGLLLNSIMRSFKPSYVAKEAEYFVKLIESNVDDGLPQYVLLRTLGECLQKYDVEDPVKVLKLSWILITKLSNPSHYMSCAHVWDKFIIKNFTVNEVNAFLGDIINHISSDEKNFYSILQDIINNILNNINDFDAIFTMDKFLPLLDLFSDESVKVSVCRTILEVFSNNPQLETTTDPVTIDALMFIAKILHDSVNALTVEDEKRQIGLLIAQLVRKINFEWDFEKQLTFYVEARGTFPNIDFVHSTLIQCVNKLAFETGRVIKSHHTQKTASFVRACAAYCFITIPSIACGVTKLRLYLLSAQVALFNQCLGQADACVKAALSFLPELPPSIEVDGKVQNTEIFLSEYVRNMLSTLLILPDCPNQGVLYLTRGLVNMLQHYTVENNMSTVVRTYVNVIDLLTTAAQEEYPYHVKKVDSNDILYGSDPKFIAEINKMCTILVDEILNHLKQLEVKEEFQAQCTLAFDLFLRIVTCSDIEAPGAANLALNLWNLAHKHNLMDKSLSIRTSKALLNRSSAYPPTSLYHQLLSKLV